MHRLGELLINPATSPWIVGGLLFTGVAWRVWTRLRVADSSDISSRAVPTIWSRGISRQVYGPYLKWTILFTLALATITAYQMFLRMRYHFSIAFIIPLCVLSF